MNSLDDLLVFPNYSNLEIKIVHPRLPENKPIIPFKIKKIIPTRNFDLKHSNDYIFQTLMEMKNILKTSNFNEEKALNNNFM